MNWWSEFADRFEHDVPLGPFTWFRLGGPVRHLFRPRSAEDLATMLVRARGEGVPVKVLGCGANVLVSDDGFDGVVIRLDGQAFRQVRTEGSTLDVGAGVDLMPFARRCSENGLTGLERMAGIPATLGGAVRMNAGGRFGDIADVVRSVRVLRHDGVIEDWPHDRVGFAYRRTRIGDDIVLSARIGLEKEDPVRVRRRFEAYFAAKQRSQPIAQKSAGCIFKNSDTGGPAGALIDRAGLKGTRYRSAHVSRQHANFIVADRVARASDVIALIDMVRGRVHRLFGTELELEIDIWGRSSASTSAS